jgi:tetratricopeptide (TPR) repeat protein
MTEQKIKNNKLNLILALILAIVSFTVFANTLSGEFVYDDRRQVVQNPLIQDSKLYAKALTSDVWAFKGDGNITVSNYWRPTFTAYSIINYQLFGLNPFGWHFLNVLLHLGICLMAYFLLRRWGLSDLVSFAIVLIFAVHPAHTESVAWIVGSPDLLFSLFFLVSLWFTQNYVEKGNKLNILYAGFFYALSLGAKEVALLCLPIYWLVLSVKKSKKDNTEKAKFDLGQITPFVIIAIVYFFTRLEIIGKLSIAAPGATSFDKALLTIPAIFLFYFRQVTLPLTLGIYYPLRTVEEFSLFSVLFPFVLSVALLALLFYVAKKSFVQKLGLAIFILPLLMTFNVTAFTPEQIVHDRYLYLPLLGFLMIFIPEVSNLIEKINKENCERILVVLVIFISLLLSIKTWNYNRVWQNELLLWSNAVKVDPASASAYTKLGDELVSQNRINEALMAYNNALNIKSIDYAHIGRAKIFLRQKKYEEAVWDFKTVVEMPLENIEVTTLLQAYEGLAIVFNEQKEFNRAIEILEAARTKIPFYYATITSKLAAVYYIKGEKQKALAELEKAQGKARTEMLPEAKTVLYRLGTLYFEFGQKEKAKAVLRDYLSLTNTMQDKVTLNNRKQASALLKKIDE